MSSARHFFKPGTLTDQQLKDDIAADVSAARKAQRELSAAGQHRTAAAMGEAVNENLDELNDARSGTWRPKHA